MMKQRDRCNDMTIKELLPAYREHGLGEAEHLRVVHHVSGCAECRAELVLLDLVAAEPVPDPGEEFWFLFPGRVAEHAPREHREKKGIEGLFGAGQWPLSVRWIGMGAAAALLLAVSWFLTPPLHQEQSLTAAGYELSQDPATADTMDTVHISELNNDELDTVSAWAGRELAAIAREAEPVVMNGAIDIDEELTTLNAREVERLSRKLNLLNQEG